MDKKKILIVGASSLLGQRFCKLFSNEYKIYSLGRTQELQVGIHIECDLLYPINYDLLPHDIDVVLYLSQSNNYKDFENYSGEIYTINTIRPFELIEYYKHKSVKQFIYASTGGIYAPSIKAHHEEEIINPNELKELYFKSKFSTELLLQSYSSYMDIVILRPFFIFGENQKNSMFFPRIINSIKNKIPIHLNGKEGMKMNPIYVEDAAKILNKIICNNLNGIFNLAGNEVLTIKEISLLIGKILKINPSFEYFQNEGYNVLGNNKKLIFDQHTVVEMAIECVLKNV